MEEEIYNKEQREKESERKGVTARERRRKERERERQDRWTKGMEWLVSIGVFSSNVDLIVQRFKAISCGNHSLVLVKVSCPQVILLKVQELPFQHPGEEREQVGAVSKLQAGCFMKINCQNVQDVNSSFELLLPFLIQRFVRKLDKNEMIEGEGGGKIN